MRLTENLYLVGSGLTGMMLTDSWDCNCYVADLGDYRILFDCGAGVKTELITEEMEKDGISLGEKDWLFLTHCHLDHVGGAYDLQKAFGVRIAVPAGEKPILTLGDEVESGLKAAKRAGYYPDEFHITPCVSDRSLNDREIWKAKKGRLEVLAVKGHSPAGCCYYLEMPEGNVLVTGDQVDADGKISLQVIPGADVLGYAESMETLQEKEVDILLPGHGRVLLKQGKTAVETAVKRLGALFV